VRGKRRRRKQRSEKILRNKREERKRHRETTLTQQYLKIGEFYASTEGNTVLVHQVGQGRAGEGAVGHLGPLSRWLGAGKLALFDKEKQELVKNSKGYCIEVLFLPFLTSFP